MTGGWLLWGEQAVSNECTCVRVCVCVCVIYPHSEQVVGGVLLQLNLRRAGLSVTDDIRGGDVVLRVKVPDRQWSWVGEVWVQSLQGSRRDTRDISRRVLMTQTPLLEAEMLRCDAQPKLVWRVSSLPASRALLGPEGHGCQSTR